MCDTPIGAEYLRQNGLEGRFVLSRQTLQNNELAFAIRKNSPLRNAIDLGITTFQDDGTIVPLCKKYIGDEASHCDL